MKNKYPAKCFKCKKRVSPQKGDCELKNGEWKVQHIKCMGNTDRVNLINDIAPFKPKNPV